MLDLYDDQKHRGQQGFGIFDGQEMNMVHESREDAILNWLCRYDSNLLLMHHRFPTSTVNVKRAAHPFSTKDYFGDTQYVLVHNGGISNADDLFDEHYAKGISYYSLLQDTTFNDSEALLWDFALFMEGRQPELTAKGGIAFICLKLVKGELQKMYFGRNSNPLNMYRSKEGIALSSEGPGEPIEPNKLYTWNYKLKRLTNRNVTIPGYTAPTFKYDYRDDDYDAYGNYKGNWNYNRGAYTYTGGQASSFGGEDWRSGLKETNGTWDYNDLDIEEESRSIGNILSRQFGAKFMKGAKAEAEAQADARLAADQLLQSPPLLLPVSRQTAQEQLLGKLGTFPTEEEVKTEYLAYLASARGHFEQAYWAIECDYDVLQDKPDTVKFVRQRVLLERVMECIQNDPEYVNEESISNIWESIWHQQELVV